MDVEGLVSWIREVNLMLMQGVTLIVEGINDVKSLRRLGVKGKIITINSVKKEIINGDISGKIFIILTDFDEEGIKIHDYLAREFRSRGALVLDRIRKGYRSLGLPSRIEESYSYVNKRVKHWREIKSFVLR